VIRQVKILGDGQIWDVKGISAACPEKTFEDLFSGRALGELAASFDCSRSKAERVFCRFKEKGKITGVSVTKALLSHHPSAKKQARIILRALALNGALGIEALTRGKGFKKNWPSRQKNYWKGLDLALIGGGVSEGKTGRLLVSLLKEYLSRDGFSRIRVEQAKFPGKEAGVLGAAAKILAIAAKEARKEGRKKIAVIGLDLGRDDIGAALVGIDPKTEQILKGQKEYCLFNCSLKTPYKKQLKKFLDSRRNYTKGERELGRRIRAAILEKMARLVGKTEAYARKMGLACSEYIAVAVPGTTAASSAILNSTDYLPFFRKKDGFNFSRSLEAVLRKKTLHNYRVYIINDGIAAGLANVNFGLAAARQGKFAFLGVGSGLGGCVGIISHKSKVALRLGSGQASHKFKAKIKSF